MIRKTDSFKGNYKYLIFDFDGTVNNTAEGIIETFKKTLDIYGVDYSDVDFNEHIGPPHGYSFPILVGDGRWREAQDTYRQIYERDKAALKCHLYDGIEDALRTLKSKGYVLSLASSKYEPFIFESLNYLKLNGIFDYVYGQTESRGFKNEILRQLIGDNGWEKSQCLMIGDTVYDINGARDNGLDVVAVTYGFGKSDEILAAKPDAVVDSTSEIVKLICGEHK
ncbi:MAG: HAD hydrolase-like protein [Corallococcus sp.]|nr:HAD hydrolase-like protein [Corallococcus sp.]